MGTRAHKVSVVVEGQQIFGWEEYEISSSLIEPSAHFSLQMPFSPAAWAILRRDARVRILIDGTTIIDGFVDDRGKRSKEHRLVIQGRSRVGRMVQESAPAINYNGLPLDEAGRRLSSPWFSVITGSDARNRRLRMGKGFKMAVGNEPITLHKVVARGRANPGQSRWSVLEEVVSNAGLMAWASADGREIFIGTPNQTQPAQFRVYLAAVGSGTRSTVTELNYDESNGDRFSEIAVVGNGGGTDTDLGEAVCSRRAVVRDNPLTPDGTGRDFLYPKRLLMPETHFDSNAEALAVAQREQARRDFKRTHVTATMPDHGEWIDPSAPTIYAPGTIAHVRDEEMDPMLDEDFFIYACTYRGTRDGAETTMIEAVPRGTRIVL